MNREIKFRAWDKKNKEFVRGCVFIGNNGRQYWWQYNMVEPEEYKSRLFNVEINQYTGLKDRHGKEIYEGDIVKIGPQQYQVMWDDKNARFILDTNDFSLGTQAKFYEVISNVFENPDLLNNK